MTCKKSIAYVLVVLMGITNLPLDLLMRNADQYLQDRNIVDLTWRASTDSNVVDNFTSLGRRLSLLRTQEAEAAAIAQNTGGIVVYADGTVGTPKYQTFDDTAGFGIEQSASSVGASAINWIRVAASPTNDEWIIATRDAANVIKAQVCTGVDGGISCGTPTQITATAGTHGFRNFDVAYEKSSGDALLVYGTATADELRKIVWSGGSWNSDAAITTTRTTGTVEWVELTSRNSSDQIGIAYSDTNDDVSAYRWNGTAVADEATAAITATAVAGDVRKFDVSFEGTSGDMLVVAWVAAAGTAATGQLVGTTWTIGTQTGVDMITGFVDLQEPNPSDNDIAAFSHGTAASANPGEGFEWSGTGVVDGTLGDDVIQNWVANAQLGATAYFSTNYYAVTVHSSAASADDIDWWTMNSAGTITDQAVNARTRGASRFIDLFDYPSLNKVLLLTSDVNSDLWADTWDGTTPSSSVWVDRTSGGARETALSTATKDVVDFAFRLAPGAAPPTTTLSNFVSAEPGNFTIAPAASAQVDSFGLQTSTGSDTVTGATVTLAAGMGQYISNVALTNDADSVTYCNAAPSGDTATFTSCGIPVSSSNVQFKVRLTAVAHTSMPVPPGGSYAVTARVTAFTSTNTQAGSDSGSSTTTVDNASPAGTTGAGAVAGNAQVTVSWTNPGDADFQQIYIYCKTSSMVSGEAPTEGTDPAVDGTACDGTARMKYKGTASPQVISSLTNGIPYYFRIYGRDTNGNFTAYASTQQVSATPSAPAVTTLSNFVSAEPGNFTIAPAASAQVDSFGLQTSTGTDTVTGATVTLTAGMGQYISNVALTNDADTVTYCNAAPSGDTATFTGCTIPVSSSNVQFKVRLTADAHADQPVPPGGSYAVTARVTAFTSTNSQAGSDSGSSTTTIDNASPAGTTGAGTVAGDTQITVSWTNPADGDFSNLVVLRDTATIGSGSTPAEGTSPSVGSSCGGTACQVRYISNGTSFIDTSLINGTLYYYRIFAKDTRGNYAAYASTQQVSATPVSATPTLTIGVTAGSQATTLNSGDQYQYINTTGCTSAATCSAFTLAISSGSETITSVKVTETGSVNASNDLSYIALLYDTDGNFSNGVTGTFGTTTAFTTEAATISGSLAINSGTTYYFYVRAYMKNGTSYPAGGNVIDFQIAANADVGTTGAPTKTGAPASLAGSTTIKPQMIGYTNSTETGLNYAASCTDCGARIGGGGGFRQTVVISGYGFGADPGANSRDTATNKVEIVGASTNLIDDNAGASNVTAWSNTSITITTDSAIAGDTDTDWGTNFGGASALKITAGGQAVPTNLNFYVFPQVTGVRSCDTGGFPSGMYAREYDATDAACPNGLTDGEVFLDGTRFGTGVGAGGVQIVSQTGGISSWSNTLIKVQAPTTIVDSVNTGNLVVTQGTGSNNKTHTFTSTNFQVLPRITANTPATDIVGNVIQIDGNHFCQSGTCPASPPTAGDTVVFGVTAAISTDFVTTPNCSGASKWSHTQICVKVPLGIGNGSQVTKVTSNTNYTSNTKAFSVLSTAPNDPTNPKQYKADGTTEIAASGTASTTSIVLKADLSASVASDILIQVEVEDVFATFDGVGIVDGTVGGGGGCTNCTSLANARVTVSGLTDNIKQWRVRTKNSSTSEVSEWVYYGTSSINETDFKIDTTIPTITSGPSAGTPGSNSATITWSTSGEPSTSRVEYDTAGTFTEAYDCTGSSECSPLIDTSPLVNNHTVTLSNLNSGTTYSYRVRSKDAAGNETKGGTQTFATASVTQPAKTVSFTIGSTGDEMAGGNATSTTFAVVMPENATNIKSAYVLVEGIYTSGLSSKDVTVAFNAEPSKTYVLPVSSKNHFKILHPVSAVALSPSTNTLTITAQSNVSLYTLSAFITITYGYTP